MKQLIQVQQMVQDGALDEKLSVLCGGKSELDAYRARLLHTLEAFGKLQSFPHRDEQNWAETIQIISTATYWRPV